MNMDNIQPLNIQITRAVIKGKLFNLFSYEEYAENKDSCISSNSNVYSAIKEEYKGKTIGLPIKGKYNEQATVPGVYDAGCIDFVIYPENPEQYVPDKIVSMNNLDSITDQINNMEIMARMDEPYLTSSDDITRFEIYPEDQPEMRALKTALNEKQMNFDKYAGRFGDNFPNDKRQLKNNGATLNIIKRFCAKMDMEAILTLRDKNEDCPNPIGREITVSLTEDDSFDEEEN